MTKLSQALLAIFASSTFLFAAQANATNDNAANLNNTFKLRNRFSITLGAGFYTPNMPKIGSSLTTGEGQPYSYARSDDYGYAFLGNLGFKLSQRNSLHFAYMSTSSHARKDPSSVRIGKIYSISTGSNIYGANTITATAYNTSSEFSLQTFNLYLQHELKPSSNLSIFPYIGGEYILLRNYAKITDTYHIANAPNSPLTNFEDFRITAQYGGLNLGSIFKYRLSNHLKLLANINAQILAMSAGFTAKQYQTYISTGFRAHSNNVNNSDHGLLALRSTDSLGVSYKFNTRPDPITLSLKGGIDYWNWAPYVVTPDKQGDKPAHMTRGSATGYFAMLQFELPF